MNWQMLLADRLLWQVCKSQNKSLGEQCVMLMDHSLDFNIRIIILEDQ